MNKFIDAYEQLKNAGLRAEHLDMYKDTQKDMVKVDTRYNTPKEAPKVAEEKINKTIEETEIYRKAKMLILEAQKKQVGYGLEKYPNPLNANTWSAIETIDHILEESIDKIHYLIMLRIKLEQELVRESKAKDDSVDALRYGLSENDALYADNAPCVNHEVDAVDLKKTLGHGEIEHIKDREAAKKALSLAGADLDGDYLCGDDIKESIIKLNNIERKINREY